jgi:hypothetical protein
LSEGFDVALVAGVEKDGASSGRVPEAVVDQIALLESVIADKVEMVDLKEVSAAVNTLVSANETSALTS